MRWGTQTDGQAAAEHLVEKTLRSRAGAPSEGLRQRRPGRRDLGRNAGRPGQAEPVPTRFHLQIATNDAAMVAGRPVFFPLALAARSC